MPDETINLTPSVEASPLPGNLSMAASVSTPAPAPDESEWDEKAFAKLVGFDDEEDEGFDPETFDEFTDTPLDISQQTDGEPTSREGNVLSDEELFDSPHNNPTPKKLSGNPFAKLAFVGVGLFLVFGTAGYFLSQIMSAGSQIGQGSDDEEQVQEDPTADFEDPMVPAENTEGELKTELALANQKNDLAALDEATGEEGSLPLAAETPADANTSPGGVTTEGNHSVTPTTSVASVRPTPVPPPPPMHQAPSPSPAGHQAPVAQATPPAPVEPTEQLNRSLVQWQMLSQLGSYERPPGADAPVNAVPATVAQSAQGLTGIPTPTVSPATQNPAILPPTAQAVPSAVSQSNLVAANTASIPAVPTVPSNQYPAPNQAAAAISSEPLMTQEDRVLQGTPIRRVNIGLSASGTLTTPIVWTDTDVDQRFVVTLETPLVNEQEEVLFAAGTPLVFYLNAIQTNGLIDASAISVITQGVETPLPQGALVLRSDEGPLLAQNAADDHSNTPSQFETMLWGALAGVGETLLQSGSSVSVSGSGGDFSYSSESGDGDILGAILQGAASPILDQITQQISDRDAQALERADVASIWYLPTGETVQVYVNLPMDF